MTVEEKESHVPTSWAPITTHTAHPVDRTDLEWWLATAGTLEWQWAKSYADFAPHWYLLPDKTRLSWDDYCRAVAVINVFGEPRKFYKRTNIELADPESGKKWWVMGQVYDRSLINMADIGGVYGDQSSAPRTAPPGQPYDAIAYDYDPRYEHDRCEVCKQEESILWRIITRAPAGATRPDYLDIGAGTGLLLKMRLVPLGRDDLYRAVEPSRGMVNRMVRRWPWVTDIHPVTYQEYLAAEDGRRFDTVTALFGSASYIDADDIPRVAALAERQTVLMHYRDGYYPDYYDSIPLPKPDQDGRSRDAAAGLARERGGKVYGVTEYQVAVIPHAA